MRSGQINLPPSAEIALVRFSALGDVTLVVPAIRNLQASFPDIRITWITSPLSYSLLQGLTGIQFEVVEKPRSITDYIKIYDRFHHRRFDAILAMQANLRINLIYPALHAPIKIGFDRIRAREGQWLFCNRAIPFTDSHLLDSFLAFATELGAQQQPVAWRLPISEADQDWARTQLQALRHPLIAIHPCASKKERTWLLDRYRAVIRFAVQNWGAGILLTGGNSQFESDFCQQLGTVAPRHTLNLCGETTPKQLAALLEQANVLLAPDTGPVHIATAMNTPVVGLYAVASPALTGPYQKQEYIVNCYPDAVRKFLGKNPDHIGWNLRVHHPQAMAMIETAEVLRQLERALESDHG